MTAQNPFIPQDNGSGDIAPYCAPDMTEIAHYFSDESLLEWARRIHLDLTDLEALTKALSVGLTVGMWRNSDIENMHAGVYLPVPAGLSAEADDALRERETNDQDEFPVTFDARSDARRTHRVATRTRQGFPIPDDVMMRANVSTTRDVHDTLTATAYDDWATPGAALVDDVMLPLGDVFLLLENRARSIRIGSTTVPAGSLFTPASWAKYEQHLLNQVGRIDLIAESFGARAALWWVACSGATYASGWFMTPTWDREVHSLADAYRAGTHERMSPLPGRTTRVQVDDFFEHLRVEPESLSAHEAYWTIRSPLYSMGLSPNKDAAPVPSPMTWFF